MNWGYKILFIYAIFIAGITFMVFRASSGNDDLVVKNYYAEELKYQERIDENDRTSALSAPVHYELKDGKLQILFPNDFAGQTLEGSAVLYCAWDAKKDMKKEFEITTERLFVDIPVAYKGAFELQLSWQAGGKHYYFQKKIML